MVSEYGPGCGQDTHDPHCLCDVTITQPVAVAEMDHIRYGWQGKRIAKRFGFSAPWSDDSLLDYFVKQTEIHDLVAAQTAPKPNKGWFTKSAWADYGTELIHQGKTNTEIRKLVEERYGTPLSRSSISHFRARLQAAEEVNA